MRPRFSVTGKVLASLRAVNVPRAVLDKLANVVGKVYDTRADFLEVLTATAQLTAAELAAYGDCILQYAAGRSYVAIVTVHGVGDQEPNKTARTVANLLLNSRHPNGTTRYTPFEEARVRIATRELDRGNPTTDTSQEFVRELLDGYVQNDPAAAYETARLEGARLDAAFPTDRRKVHIYDMFWADLTQLGSGLVRVFTEFFLLIFHVGDLGRRTAKVASQQPDASGCWKCIYGLQTFIVWLLTGPIVILNLYELAVVLLAVPLKLEGPAHAIVAVAVFAILASFLVGKLLFRLQAVWGAWSLIGLLLIVVGVWASVPFLLHESSESYHRLLALEWCVVAGWLLYCFLKPYCKTRDQSGGWKYATGVFAIVLGVGTVGWFAFNVFFAFPYAPRWSVYTAGLRTFEVLFFQVTIAWLLLFFLILVQSFLLLAAWFFSDFRGKQAVGTVFISVLHPTAMFRVLTLAFWGTLWFSLRQLNVVPSDIYYDPVTPLFSSQEQSGNNVNAVVTMALQNQPLAAAECSSYFLRKETMLTFGEKALSFSGTIAFTPALLLIGVALVVSVWGLFPAVWAEVHPPAGPNKKSSKSLGKWLNSGYIFLFYVGTILMFLAVPILFPVGYAIRLAEASNSLGSYPLLDKLVSWSREYDSLKYLSLGLSGVIVGVFSFRGPLQQLALGFHAAVRVALDVDNYMREFPFARTPRARMFARYASLLRYLCKWRDPADGRGYGAIVLVAHSQGTVITADLLRFLRLQVPQDAALSPLGLPRAGAGPLPAGDGQIPVYVLTVGSPLRQLYGWRFPHLFAWAFDATTIAPLPGAAWPIPAARDPVPGDLGLTFWINAYRSGDYVGRYIWRPGGWGFLWDPGVASAGNNAAGSLVRQEVCLPAGAHTHYFDETASEVGQLLDDLVDQACRCAEANPPRYPQ